jgi:hypothetical protein
MIVLSSYGGTGDDSVSVKGELVAFLGGVGMAFYLSGTMPIETLNTVRGCGKTVLGLPTSTVPGLHVR